MKELQNHLPEGYVVTVLPKHEVSVGVNCFALRIEHEGKRMVICVTAECVADDSVMKRQALCVIEELAKLQPKKGLSL